MISPEVDGGGRGWVVRPLRQASKQASKQSARQPTSFCGCCCSTLNIAAPQPPPPPLFVMGSLILQGLLSRISLFTTWCVWLCLNGCQGLPVDAETFPGQGVGVHNSPFNRHRHKYIFNNNLSFPKDRSRFTRYIKTLVLSTIILHLSAHHPSNHPRRHEYRKIIAKRCWNHPLALCA